MQLEKPMDSGLWTPSGCPLPARSPTWTTRPTTARSRCCLGHAQLETVAISLQVVWTYPTTNMGFNKTQIWISRTIHSQLWILASIFEMHCKIFPTPETRPKILARQISFHFGYGPVWAFPVEIFTRVCWRSFWEETPVFTGYHHRSCTTCAFFLGRVLNIACHGHELIFFFAMQGASFGQSFRISSECAKVAQDSTSSGVSWATKKGLIRKGTKDLTTRVTRDF